MKSLKSFFAMAAATLALAAPLAAQADVVYTFDAAGPGAFGSGPFGTVTLVENGTSVDFTISLRSDLNFVNTGGPHSVFSFNAKDVAPADISNIKFNGVDAGANFTVITSGGNQPFGSTFSLAIDCTGKGCKNGAPGQSIDPLTFTIANATYADFGFLNGNTTAFFASDVICTTGSCNGTTGSIGVTSAGTSTPPSQVPEPASIALIGLGLLGATLARRRKA